jgi:hypothetical protein
LILTRQHKVISGKNKAAAPLSVESTSCKTEIWRLGV